jgi:hypothetical protein
VLSKKLEATQRKQNIEYIFKEGVIVMTADAVTFELLSTICAPRSAFLVAFWASGVTSFNSFMIIIHFIYVNVV